MSEDTESSPETTAATGNGNEWYADGLRFKCTQCGNCCTGGPGYVWFDDDEAQAMADQLGIEKREFYQR